MYGWIKKNVVDQWPVLLVIMLLILFSFLSARWLLATMPLDLIDQNWRPR